MVKKMKVKNMKTTYINYPFNLEEGRKRTLVLYAQFYGLLSN